MTQLTVYPLTRHYGAAFKTILLSFAKGYVGCIRKAIERRYLQGAVFLTLFMIPSMLAQSLVASAYVRFFLPDLGAT